MKIPALKSGFFFANKKRTYFEAWGNLRLGICRVLQFGQLVLQPLLF
jgi:hypothetical protein